MTVLKIMTDNGSPWYIDTNLQGEGLCGSLLSSDGRFQQDLVTSGTPQQSSGLGHGSV